MASRREMIADLVSKHKLPAIYSTSTFVRSGGLIGYGFDRADLFHTAISAQQHRSDGRIALSLLKAQPWRPISACLVGCADISALACALGCRYSVHRGAASLEAGRHRTSSIGQSGDGAPQPFFRQS